MKLSSFGAGLGLLLVLGTGALAQDEQTMEELVELCTTCHGEEGRPIEPDYPIIWGQEFYYLYVQLKDYKSGRRANEIMQPIVEELSKDQMKAVAQVFADKEWPRIGFAAEESDIKSGQTAASAGQCTQCHLGGYNGNSRNPRLAGQNPAYLERTMLEFKDKTRLNAPDKGALFRAYDDADITAMANFMAGM
ncbi:MAG: cytochrome c4 [Alphaproteobacteria bacterium]|nr:cytochrome c4 [Alphaproteobacteria bacterium]